MKHWEIKDRTALDSIDSDYSAIISLLLRNRGITEKDEVGFLHPQLTAVTPETVDLDTQQIEKTINRIKKGTGEKRKSHYLW